MSSREHSLASSIRAQAVSDLEAKDVWAYYKYVQDQRPRFFRAIAKDAMVFALHRGEISSVRTKARRMSYALLLPFRASEYLGLVLYRLRAVLKSVHVPLLPSIFGAICGIVWGIRIGDPVVMDEGIYIPHGQIVIDGLVFVGKGSELCPWITIGLRQGDPRGPWLEEGVFVGTGAKILGNVHLGKGAHIGANAVVISSVGAWATAVGVPARVIPNVNSPTHQDGAETPSGDIAER